MKFDSWKTFMSSSHFILGAGIILGSLVIAGSILFVFPGNQPPKEIRDAQVIELDKQVPPFFGPPSDAEFHRMFDGITQSYKENPQRTDRFGCINTDGWQRLHGLRSPLDKAAFVHGYGYYGGASRGFAGYGLQNPNYTFSTRDDNFLLHGANQKGATSIVISTDRSKGLYSPPDFQTGDTQWCMKVTQEELSFLDGDNTFTIATHFSDGSSSSYRVFVHKVKTKEVITSTNEITVDFFDVRKKLSDKSVLTDALIEGYNYEYGYGNTASKFEQTQRKYDFWHIGTVTSGAYTGDELIIVESHPLELGSTDFHRALYNKEKDRIIALTTYGGVLYPPDDTIFLAAPNITIKDFVLPSEIDISGSDISLSSTYSINTFFDDYSNPKTKLFSTPDGDVYENNKGSFSMKNRDGTVKDYRYEFPFLISGGSSWQGHQLDLRIDGKISGEKYVYQSGQGHCGGFTDDYHIVTDADFDASKRLELAGTTPQGYEFFELDNVNDPWLKDLYEKEGTLFSYQNGYYYDDVVKPSYEEFLAIRPLLFWKDPFDRWIVFTNQQMSYAAECDGGGGPGSSKF